MKTRTFIAATGLAAALALGTGSAAFAAGDAPSSTAAPEQVAEHCAKVPAVQERIDTAQAKVAAALTKLTDAKAKAEADGKTRRAERLGKAIARVQQRADRLAERETKLQAWSSAHCGA